MHKQLIMESIGSHIEKLKNELEYQKKWFLMARLSGDNKYELKYKMISIELEENEKVYNFISKLEFNKCPTKNYMSKYGTFSDKSEFIYDDRLLKLNKSQVIVAVLCQIIHTMRYYAYLEMNRNYYRHDYGVAEVYENLSELGIVEKDFKVGYGRSKYVERAINEYYGEDMVLFRITEEAVKELDRLEGVEAC